MATGDFNSCVQDSAHQCWFNTETGAYNLTTANGGIRTGTGVIGNGMDFFSLNDYKKDYRFKVAVKDGVAAVEYASGSTHIQFSGDVCGEC